MTAVTPLYPIIKITDSRGNPKFEWQHIKIGDRQDFRIESWRIQEKISSRVGTAQFMIQDHGNHMTDNTPQAKPLIEAGDLCIIQLGHTESTMTNWFSGICDEPELIRPGANQQMIKVKAIGYAIRFSSKFITINHEQKLTEDEVPDDTDDSAKISEILKTILTDESVMEHTTPDSRLDITNIADIDIKLKEYKKTNKSQASIIDELARVVNCVYGVTPNLEFFFRPATLSSGITITNDTTDTAPNRLYMRNKKYSYQDSVARNAHTTMIGLGGIVPKIIRDDTTGNRHTYEGGAFEIEAQQWKYIDIAFREGVRSLLEEDNTFTTLVRGAISTDPFDGQTAQYVGGITLTEKSESIGVIDYIDLNGNNQTAKWYRLEPNFPAPQEGQHYYIQVTPDSVLNDLAHGVLYSLQSTGERKIRHKGYQERRVKFVAENTTLTSKLLEKQIIQDLRNVEVPTSEPSTIAGLMEIAGRTTRSYSGITTSVPDNYLEVGKLYNIVDKFQALNTYAVLIGFNIEGDLKSGLATVDISLDLEEWV